MSPFKFIVACLILLMVFIPLGSYAFQDSTIENRQLSGGLFDKNEVLNISLEGDIETLLNDRGDDPSYHILTLHVNDAGVEESLDLRVRVRGNFRRLPENCDTPPLKFNFKRHDVPEESIFAGNPELKLVVPCKGEDYVAREYLTYKLYNLFTDYSFRVRMVRFTFDDMDMDEITNPRYGFLIEDKDVLASRNNASLIERLNYRPQIVDQMAFHRMSVFAYMIGNTDWSIQYLHNIELLFLNEEKIFVSVPYDFDLVGFVSSPYARPSPALKLRSVRERVYRGYCLEDLNVLNSTFQQFQELRPKIYSIITESSLIDGEFMEFATDYLDNFFETLEDDRKMSREFSYPCSRHGTGNVVISGMRDG